MKISFEKLVLLCRKSEEVVTFSDQVTYFHGQISAGKSSIVRLIDYCLGGDLEKTPAISQEMVSAQLFATIGDNKVLFERSVNDTTSVQVTWTNQLKESSTVLAPLSAGKASIWQDDIYNLSDLIFHLSNIRPIKVKRSKIDADSPLVRLSFRDLMWYCYLEQDDLDSSFYNLTDTFKKLKSRDAMRFITGLYTERLNELEIRLDELRSERAAKLESIKQIRTFLQDFGYSSESDVSTEIISVENRLLDAQQELAKIRAGHTSQTHFADNLREKLRDISQQIQSEQTAFQDLDDRIREQEELKAELLSAKFKLTRATAASNLLAGVKFDVCPACGQGIHKHSISDTCYLCGQEISSDDDEQLVQAEAIRRDLNARVEDLSESINRHTIARKRQNTLLEQLKQRKSELDIQLNNELANYDSLFLANSREAERLVATLEERKRNLEKIAKMPESVSRMEQEAGDLFTEAEKVRREIDDEKFKLTDATNRIKDIEIAYLEALNKTRVPGIEDDDRILIDPKNWIPKILPPDGDVYDFYNAGSGGKKTLLNVCYALAIHEVAAEHNLPLPTFLMIDTPMKNIGEDVNKDIFRAFYQYLYQLVNGALSQTQVIVIDKEYFPPSKKVDVNIIEKFMSPDSPLISYYRGP